MLITIKNIIGAIRNVLGIVTDGLKMWLPFERSQMLSNELIINGDFSNGTSDWSTNNNATISVGTHQGKDNVASIEITTSTADYVGQSFDFTSGKLYLITTEVYVESGTFRIDATDSQATGDFITTAQTGEWLTLSGYMLPQSTGSGLIFLRATAGVASQFYVKSFSIKEVIQFAPDTSGNSNNATLYTGKALSFDGVNDYLNCGNIGVSLKTLAFWVNLDSTTEKVLQVTSSQSVEVSSGTITLNGTWTGSTIYVDATATSTIAASSYKRVVITTTSAITVDDLELGRISSSYGDFILSDFQIYNQAWTQTDVTYDYNKPNHLVTDNPSTSIALSNLKGYWALSEGDGAIAYDSSGEDNDGTINGATYVDKQPTIPQLGMMDWSKGSNVLQYSNDFSNSHWSINGVDRDSGYIAPDGTATAYKVSQNGVGILLDYNVSPNIGVTRSIWAKTVSGTGTVHLTSNFGNTNSIFTITNEWQRFSAISGSVAPGNFYAVDFRDSSTTLTEVILWGAQEEVNVGDSLSAFRKTNGAATLNSTVIPNPNNPSQDILGNSVRLREHSFNLDGSGYAEVADDDSLDFGTGDFSVEAWVRFEFKNQGSSLNTIYSNGEEVNDTNTFSLVSDQNNKIGFYVNATSCFSTSTFSKDDWVHVVGTRIQGTNGVKLYINGNTTPEASATNNNTVTNSFNKTIGRDTHSSRYYNNIISDVRVYSQALTSDEIEQNYNAGLSQHKVGSSFSDDFSGDYGN